jgi:hypothetical protein
VVDAIVELPSSLLLGFGLIINYLPPGALPLCLFFFCLQSGGHSGLEPPFRWVLVAA